MKKKFFNNVVVSEDGRTIERPLAIDINHVGGAFDQYEIELKVGGATCFYEMYYIPGDEVTTFLHSLYDYNNIQDWDGCQSYYCDEEEDEVYELNVNSPFWLMSLYRSEAEGEEEIWNVCAYASPLFFPAEKRTKIVFRGTLNQMIGVIQRIQRLNKAYNQEVLTPDDEENSEEHNNNLNY